MVDGYLVEEGLVEGGVLPLQLVDLLVELGLYVGALHLEVLQGVYTPLHHLGEAGERWGFIRVMWTEGGQSMRGATSSPLPVFRCTEQLPCDRQRRRRVCTSSTGTSPCSCTLVILVPLHVSRGRPHQAVCSGYTGTSPCILRATPPGCVCTGYTGVTGTSPCIRRGTPPGRPASPAAPPGSPGSASSGPSAGGLQHRAEHRAPSHHWTNQSPSSRHWANHRAQAVSGPVREHRPSQGQSESTVTSLNQSEGTVTPLNQSEHRHSTEPIRESRHVTGPIRLQSRHLTNHRLRNHFMLKCLIIHNSTHASTRSSSSGSIWQTSCR